MVFSKNMFKCLWEANDWGSGITYDDIADCAKDWGLYQTPRIHDIDTVTEAVLKAANCKP